MASYAGSAERKTGPTHGSQCWRILEVLLDRAPHRMEEIHERAGFCRLNSRVSELRGRYGYRITCDKTGGVFTYQLHDSSLEAEAAAYASASSERGLDLGNGTGAVLGGTSASSESPVRSTPLEGGGTEANHDVRASSPSEPEQLALELVA